jgi:hypothetical protein
MKIRFRKKIVESFSPFNKKYNPPKPDSIEIKNEKRIEISKSRFLSSGN